MWNGRCCGSGGGDDGDGWVSGDGGGAGSGFPVVYGGVDGDVVDVRVSRRCFGGRCARCRG